MSLKDNLSQLNIKLTLAYDGTAYLGWQKTPIGASIEAALQTILQKILQEEVRLQAASRTDAGVHASGQVVNFLSKKEWIDLNLLQLSLNSLLPKDIVVVTAQNVPLPFHPTLDCVGKEYHYSICNAAFQFPEFRQHSWHVYQTLNRQLMDQAAPLFCGKKDFSAFTNSKKNEKYLDHVRCLDEIEVHSISNSRFYIRMKGNHFLYKMARNIAGTLVDIGRGKLSIHDVPQILVRQDRRLAGVTAPAHGLSLKQVFYET